MRTDTLKDRFIFKSILMLLLFTAVGLKLSAKVTSILTGKKQGTDRTKAM